MTKSSTIYYEIKGLENGKCAFYLKVKKESISFSSSASQSAIDSGRASFKNQQGNSGTCLFETTALYNMLTRWEHGDTSSQDFNVAACSGSYFR